MRVTTYLATFEQLCNSCRSNELAKLFFEMANPLWRSRKSSCAGDLDSLEPVLTPVSAFQPASISDSNWQEREEQEPLLPYDPPER